MDQNPAYDVAIVGLGPTGASLAALLGLQGLSVLVLERESDIYDLPRAVHFDDETMRVFQWIGIADDLRDKVIINPGARFIDPDGRVLVDWPRPTAITENGWHASYRFHQPDLEQLLRSRLASIDGVDIRLSHNVEYLQDLGSHVVINYRDMQKDKAAQTTASFVVGCDGARSIVRHSMPTHMTELGFEQRWLVIDVLLERDMPELGRHTLQFCNPERPATYCCNVGNRRRWEFALHEHEQDADMIKEDAVWALLKRWISPNDAELERLAIYTFKSEVAEDWVKGRMLLAGDAAHLTPPFMGQGLCAGIRDAANLAWKLAHCQGGRDHDALLITYQSERKPHATHYVETAARMGALVNSMDADEWPLFGAESKAGAMRMESIKRPLGPGLGDPSDRNRGTLFPQFLLNDGKRSDDHVDHAFFIAIDMRDRFKNDDLGSFQVISADDEPGLKAVLASIDAKAVIIRPDKHILASTNQVELIDTLVKSALGVWS